MRPNITMIIRPITYRITAVLKVKTDIIASIAASPTYNDNVCRDLQNWSYCFYRWHQNMNDVTLTNNFQYQSGQWSRLYQRHASHRRENVQFADNYLFSGVIHNNIIHGCPYYKKPSGWNLALLIINIT